MDKDANDKVRKKLFRFASEKLELQCEYDDCDFIADSSESFLSHIDQCHFSQLTDDDGDSQCHWKDCETSICSSQELRRHTLLHAHHAKIKCHGKNLQIRNKLPECALGSQNRNLVSKMLDSFLCCWGGCLLSFNNPAIFYLHMDMHVSNNANEPKPLKCWWSKCQKTFMDPYKLKEHVKGHSKEKVVACPVCGAMFASRTKFSDHLFKQISVTGSSEIHSCEYCPKKLPTERLLKEHTRTHVCHYKCPKCDMTCPTPSMLRAHVNYRHFATKSHSCQYCDYKCKRKGDLQRHLETHNDISPYACQIEGCDYNTRSKSCLKHHTNSKHGPMEKPKYQCHVCDKVMTRGNYLTKHMADKHNINWPAGHTRFKYNLEDDGFYRLQTVRYESTDMREAILDDERDLDDPSEFEEVENDVSLGKCAAPECNNQMSQPDRPEPCETQFPVSSTMPMTLFVENSNGDVSECTVSLQGTVTDIILVTPDGKECDPMSLWQ